ncbi:MAG: glycosyltransferase family 39 protein, partial [candidate division Zixibacteria bacterium]|nr:glycosyltransferase family 39 protein [candidate division Zixibacteria bacterium]
PEQVMGLSSDTVNYVDTAKGLLGLQPLDQQWVFLFGPGYGVFLAACFLLFGVGPIAAIIVQIILSGLTCLLLYSFGKELTGSGAVGYGAGIISATSFTAISQAAILLSDTLFLFLFLAGNLLFLKGLKNGKRSHFFWSGIVLGAAVLTRAVGQFWPPVLIILIGILPMRSFGRSVFPNRRSLFKRAIIAPLVALVIMGGWTARNYAVHGMPVVAGSGLHGLGRLTAYAQMKLEDRSLGDVFARWADEYKREHHTDSIPLREWYALVGQKAGRMMAEHPRAMLWYYLGRIKVNITAANDLYVHQLPRSKDMISYQMGRIHRMLLHFVIPILTVWGFWLMVKRRQWMPALFLGSMYLLFFFMVGFGMWQGSRLFFPSQIAWSVVVSYLVIESWPRLRLILYPPIDAAKSL